MFCQCNCHFSKQNAKEGETKVPLAPLRPFLLAAISSHLAGPLRTVLVIYEECLIEYLIKFTSELGFSVRVTGNGTKGVRPVFYTCSKPELA